jgi:hypothetical protein
MVYLGIIEVTEGRGSRRKQLPPGDNPIGVKYYYYYYYYYYYLVNGLK